jgi:ketosteroid isomerase-like protein
MTLLDESDFRDYIDAFNRSDFPAYSRYYATDVEFAGRAAQLKGRDAVIQFYRQVHARMRETLQIQQIVQGGRTLVADMVTELEALEDWPDFPTGAIKRGEIRRSQNFIWYDLSGKEFTRIRAAHYRRGTFTDFGPVAAAAPSNAAALSAAEFSRYIDAFNHNDENTFGEFYDPDVILVIAGKHTLGGRQAIFDFYRSVKAQTRRTIQVNQLITTPGAIAAELQSEFLALEDLPDFTAGPLKRGERLFINTVVLYDLRDGKFSRIRSAELRKIHRPATL